MAFDYAEMAEVALELMAEFGRPVTLHAESETAVDPDDPLAGTEAAADPEDLDTQAVTAVITDYALNEIDGYNVIAGDKKMTVAPEAANLDRFTRVDDGGTMYQVVGVKPVQPGDTVVVYFFHLRRAGVPARAA